MALQSYVLGPAVEWCTPSAQELDGGSYLMRSFLFYTFIYFIYFYFWLHWVFIAACGLSLVAASGGYSWLRCTGFSLQWLLLLQSTGSKRTGFSSCGTWAQ